MNTIFLAGHSRLPSGMAAQNMYETLTITAEIDKQYAVIVSASCTLATVHGQEFVQQLLKGHSLQNGIEGPVESVRHHYLGKAGNAIIAALKDLHKQYETSIVLK
ncbi:DUF3870 domain-containing protein [Sporosarcina sp. ACRSM]|uniref:DUF3870 domain-containing protein n=1 Tax=Sporosarcina sp. ACRSM TaxID=2918216 RepID=UPI001EF74036|nr:DUF3870 domain-containing protein [Sporosarcina sp. ACRSM]MCG7334689.1 DUF3870 domain-containing protein [Sporosarcina sp. ACRSM]